jgi:hypothetical protein
MGLTTACASLQVWEVGRVDSTGEIQISQARIPTNAKVASGITCMCLHPDDTRAITLSIDGDIRMGAGPPINYPVAQNLLRGLSEANHACLVVMIMLTVWRMRGSDA